MDRLKFNIHNNIGIGGLGDTKIYYPSKPRSCHNCHHSIFSTKDMIHKGCILDFAIINQDKEKNKPQHPKEKCYPVMDDTVISETHAYHVRKTVIELKGEEDYQ